MMNLTHVDVSLRHSFIALALQLVTFFHHRHALRGMMAGGTLVRAFHEEERVEKLEKAVTHPRAEPAV
jgi:hypothetical protein